jgi:ATP-dependent helicase HrpB
VVLANLFLLLMGFAILSRHFEKSRIPDRLGDAPIDVVPLHGTLDSAAQDRAIAPAPAGRRKVVLATSIAETSLTIEGVVTRSVP